MTDFNKKLNKYVYIVSYSQLDTRKYAIILETMSVFEKRDLAEKYIEKFRKRRNYNNGDFYIAKRKLQIKDFKK